jgi:hypothetical protein
MSTRTDVAAAFAAAHLSSFAQADPTAEIRSELRQLREQYEARIKALEQRLEAAERARAAAPSSPVAAESASAPAPPAPAAAPPTPVPQPATSSASRSPSSPGLAVSAVLAGTYAHLRNDPASYRLQGFIPGGEETGPGERGFNLGESELTLAANVDPYFAGRLTFALTPDNEAEVEEAFARTTALPGGVTVTMGRFLSSLGYLNNQHAHTWDFVDAPLAHQAFFGGRHATDGLQLKWIAPTETYVELTGELGRGNAFPGTDRLGNGFGSASLGARLGGDLGDAASWRAGYSFLRTKSTDRTYEDADSAGTTVANAFSGSSRTHIVDAVFKWAPAGNRLTTSFKLQGEYFWRRERGDLTYDVDGASVGTATAAYRSQPAGGYVQGVYQFARVWRVGLRYDRLKSGTPSIGLVDDGTLSAADFPLLASFAPRRTTAMVDYSLTEFSRLRLQLADVRSQPGRSDRQVFLQYLMSLGAHAAHSY